MSISVATHTEHYQPPRARRLGTRLVRLFLLTLVTLLSQGIRADLSERYTEKMPLVIVINQDFPPYEFSNEGEPEGYVVDVLKEILEKNNVPYRFVMKRRYQGMYMFEHNEADLMVDHSQRFTAHSQYPGADYYVISRSVIEYYKLRVAAHKKWTPISTIEQLKETRGVMLRKDDQATQDMVKAMIPDVAFEKKPLREAMKEIAAGKQKYLVWGEAPLIYTIRSLGLTDEVTLGSMTVLSGELHFVGHDKELMDMIDDQYARMDQNGNLQKLHDKWFHPERVRSNKLLSIIGVGFGILVFIVLLGWYNKRIHNRKELARRRAEDLRTMMLQALKLGDYAVWGYDLHAQRIMNLYGNKLPEGGIGREEFYDHIHPDERAVFQHEIRQLIETGMGSLVLDQRWKPFDDPKDVDEQGWVALRGHVIAEKDVNGRVNMLVGTVKNVTKDYQDERNIEELSARFEKLFQTTLVGMSFYDKQGKLVGLNDNMRKICGFDEAGEDFFRKTSLFEAPMFKGDLDPYHPKHVHACQHMYYPDAGLDKYLEYRILPTYENDELQYYVVTVRDVTAERIMYMEIYRQDLELQKTVQKRNRYSEELRYLLENSNIWVWRSDMEKKLISFSRSLHVHEFSMTFDEFRSLLYPDQTELAMKELGNMNGEDRNLNVTLHFKKSPVHTTAQWEAINGVPVYDEQGRVTGHFGIVRDVTTLMEVQEQLRRETARAEDSGKLKSVFLANMTHEIRTPLNAIVGFSDLLQVIDNKEERREFMRIIRNNCDMLMRLINDIIEASNMNQSPLTIEADKVDFAVAFNDVCQTLAQRVQEPGVEFLVDNPYESFVTTVDKGRLQQVITNFTTNAVKYTHEGHIKVGMRYLSFEELKDVTKDLQLTDQQMPFSGIYLYCEDTGAGIPKEKQASVFERFVKLNDYVQGTGLGLSICKSIAERCAGRIGVMSEGEGKGSTFWIWIPCEKRSEVLRTS
ncbi:MAG: transporter substrate-binding domain-containing protein [Prevotella sp.]|nr:transporter substrate-binding domain-containing protein [Prevotella sp.]